MAVKVIEYGIIAIESANIKIWSIMWKKNVLIVNGVKSLRMVHMDFWVNRY